MAWLTGVLAIASLFQGYFLIRADRTAKIAADAAIVAQRPWVKAEITRHGPLNYVNGFWQIDFSITVKCFGNTPAKAVRTWVAMAAAPADIPIREARAKIPIFDGPGGFSLFPGEIETEQHRALISDAEVNAMLPSSAFSREVLICAIGYVTYTYSGGRGETTVTYIVSDGTGVPGQFARINLNAAPILAAGLLHTKIPVAETAR